MIDFILTLLAVVGGYFTILCVRLHFKQRREFEAVAQQTAREAIHGMLEAAGPDLTTGLRHVLMRALTHTTRQEADLALRMGKGSACVLLNRVSEIIYQETYK